MTTVSTTDDRSNTAPSSPEISSGPQPAAEKAGNFSPSTWPVLDVRASFVIDEDGNVSEVLR